MPRWKLIYESAGIEDVSDDDLDLDIGIGSLIEQDTEIDELLKIVFDDGDLFKCEFKNKFYPNLGMLNNFCFFIIFFWKLKFFQGFW